MYQLRCNMCMMLIYYAIKSILWKARSFWKEQVKIKQQLLLHHNLSLQKKKTPIAMHEFLDLTSRELRVTVQVENV